MLAPCDDFSVFLTGKHRCRGDDTLQVPLLSNVTDTREAAAEAFLLADLLKPRMGETLSGLKLRAITAKPPLKNGSALELLMEKDKARGMRYSMLTWETAVLRLDELSVWPKMDHLPEEWCEGSVIDVVEIIKRNELPAGARRLRRILETLRDEGAKASAEWFELLPLLAVPETVLHNRSGYHPAWTLDDGCSRAVALGLLGVGHVTVLVGHAAD